jgi:hypothetical protein
VISDYDIRIFAKVVIPSTLYIKEEELNTATRNIEKNYFRVDKKTTS